MFPEEESEKKKTKAVSLGKPAAGQCLCGKVAFEIDVPARWAWHDHSPSSRRAHGAAYATYVGSWRKRFRITKGKTSLARYEDKATKTVRSFCSTAARRSPMSARARRTWSTFPARCSRAAPAGSRSITSRSRNCRNGPTPANRWCR